MSAGFDKQLPQDHEYIKTFYQYRDLVFGANRIVVVVRQRTGDIWNAAFLKKLNEVTQAVMFLPGVDRRTVTSLWTPTTRVLEITEEGFQAEDVIGGNITPDALDAGEDRAHQAQRRRRRLRRAAGRDRQFGRDGRRRPARVRSGHQARRSITSICRRSSSSEVRQKLETPEFEIQIIGFAKQIGDIADGAKSVARFFLLAFLLTAASVYVYSRSWVLTVLPLACSLASVVWQFGTLQLLGYGLDPLAVLVPFLVFAIGVSHGIQQINYISKEIRTGVDTVTAARRSFTGLLIPGTMALVTAFVGFATLTLIPIPMIRELGITASIGVAYKIVTNLVMLPLAVSYFRFDEAFVERVNRERDRLSSIMGWLLRGFTPRNAALGTLAGAVLFAVAFFQSQGRHIGHLQPGAPELHADSRYNRDASEIVSKFDLGLDVLSVVVETPKDGCYDYATMEYVNQFSWQMQNVPGVLSVASAALLAKQAFSGFNEGNPKWAALPRDPKSLANAISMAPEGTGLWNPGCTVLPVHLYLADHKATTIKAVVGAVKAFRAAESERAGRRSGSPAAMSACRRRPTRCSRPPSCR